jgi:hypothetical protein
VIELIQHHIIPAAYELLPTKMNRPEATAMLLAIGLQESRFQHRTQMNGPARSFWQFEAGGGCAGVLGHVASKRHIIGAHSLLQYDLPVGAAELHRVIADNDVLAAVCARLLLWTDSRPMPRKEDGPEAAWQLYARTWRPGKPHRETWDKFHESAWARIDSTR